MNGKQARRLRKALEISNAGKRTYNVAEVPTEAIVQQFDSINNKIKYVKRTVYKKIVECTQAERILYKYYKTKYNDNNKGELVLNPLPTTEALHEFTEKISSTSENLLGSEERILTTT